MMHMHTVHTAKDDTNTHNWCWHSHCTQDSPLLVHADLPPTWLEINPGGNISLTINQTDSAAPVEPWVQIIFRIQYVGVLEGAESLARVE